MLVTGVPLDVPASQLEVSIDTRAIKVSHRVTGDVYLEGTLWRAIVPEDSTWTFTDDDERATEGQLRLRECLCAVPVCVCACA